MRCHLEPDYIIFCIIGSKGQALRVISLLECVNNNEYTKLYNQPLINLYTQVLAQACI